MRGVTKEAPLAEVYESLGDADQSDEVRKSFFINISPELYPSGCSSPPKALERRGLRRERRSMEHRNEWPRPFYEPHCSLLWNGRSPQS